MRKPFACAANSVEGFKTTSFAAELSLKLPKGSVTASAQQSTLKSKLETAEFERSTVATNGGDAKYHLNSLSDL